MKKYLQVYYEIKKNITSGIFPKGQKIPSKRDCALKYGVSIISVEHAYDLLISEGYIESKERSGYFVCFSSDNFFTPSEKFTYERQAEKQKEEGISFDKIAKITRYVLSEHQEELLVKSENKGTIFLREAIKNYLKRNKNIEVDINQIVVGAGAEYLYGMITELLPYKTIAIENPSYPQIQKVYQNRKIKCEPLDISFSGIPTSALNSTTAKVLHITPLKSYPNGLTTDISKKNEYLTWAKERNGFIIEDDFESEFSLNGNVSQTVFSLDENDRVIYINTFSKTISKAIRVGYMILPKRLEKDFDEKLSFYSCTVPTLIQYVIAEILSDGTFEKHINSVRRKRKNELKTKK